MTCNQVRNSFQIENAAQHRKWLPDYDNHYDGAGGGGGRGGRGHGRGSDVTPLKSSTSPGIKRDDARRNSERAIDRTAGTACRNRTTNHKRSSSSSSSSPTHATRSFSALDCGTELLKIQEIVAALCPNNTPLCNLKTSGGTAPRILNSIYAKSFRLKLYKSNEM